MKIVDDISQIAIIMFGCSAIYLIGCLEKWRRWGYILGLCSQPFWVFTAIYHEQSGIFLISLCYSYAWIQGIWNYWIKKG